MDIRLKRVYLPADATDGKRVLVDRLWPRGVKKEDARIDVWMKDIAPSPELCKAFQHVPDRFEWFRSQYVQELLVDSNKRALCADLRDWSATSPVTLVFATKDEIHNHVVVLRDILNGDTGTDGNVD